MDEKTELIKKLISNKGMSVRKFAESIGIPNTTLNSMLTRGIDNASVNNVIKVCSALNISVETLYDICKNGNILTNEETALLESFNKLNDLGKTEANKRVAELSYMPMYCDNKISTTKNNVVEITPKKELTYDDFETVAAHNDGWTDDEIAEADRRILEDINKRR